MNTNIALGIAFVSAAILSAGCDAALPYVSSLTCATVPWYVADCQDPAVQAKAESVLTDGVVEAQINCRGVALNPSLTKAVTVDYHATRLQDGACFATVTIAAPGTTGFALENGAQLSPRSLPASDTCRVSTYRAPLSESVTSVSSGVITVESAHCLQAGVLTCSMPVASNCTGINVGSF